MASERSLADYEEGDKAEQRQISFIFSCPVLPTGSEFSSSALQFAHSAQPYSDSSLPNSCPPLSWLSDDDKLRSCRWCFSTKQQCFLSHSAIIGGNEFYQSRLYQFLTPAVGLNPQWVLCYRASTHGWAVSTFHSRCDGRRDTVTIIKKDTSETLGSTSNAFIFSLRNNEDLGPFKSNVTNPSRAIYRGSGYGPTFGWGLDIHIADNANSNTNSYSNFGEYNDYSVPSGVQEEDTILAGTPHFTPDEVEVFYLG
ncbi:uncharacterized protein LOC110061916 [Orbicella faveolata]|uniref:uncharacterized protein LOC110061916 n=1 Tax=Orbicella faveolata TaxID=48498 RepID=UPI0009E5BA8B|nr:uncharacterized protein LOC110061916 [Orbicella faveolata]